MKSGGIAEMLGGMPSWLWQDIGIGLLAILALIMVVLVWRKANT